MLTLGGPFFQNILKKDIAMNTLFMFLSEFDVTGMMLNDFAA